MAVRIRLKRMGGKKRPFYRLVVADSRTARDGRVIEELGYYDPLTEPVTVRIDEERALDWLRKGAQPSDTARRLLDQAGVLDKFTRRETDKDKAAADEPEAANE